MKRIKRIKRINFLTAFIILLIGVALLLVWWLLPTRYYSGIWSAHLKYPTNIDVSPDGSLIAINDDTMRVYVIDYNTHAIRYTVTIPEIETTVINEVIINDDNELFFDCLQYDEDFENSICEYIVRYSKNGDYIGRIDIPIPSEGYLDSCKALCFREGKLCCVQDDADEVFSLIEIDPGTGSVEFVSEFINEEDRVMSAVSPTDDGSYIITWDNGEFGFIHPDGSYENIDSFDFKLRQERTDDNLLMSTVISYGNDLIVRDGVYWDVIYKYSDGTLTPFIDISTIYGFDGDINSSEYYDLSYDYGFQSIWNEGDRLSLVSGNNIVLTDGTDIEIISGDDGYGLPFGEAAVNLIKVALLYLGGAAALIGVILLLGNLLKWHLNVFAKMLVIIIPIVVICLIVITQFVLKQTEDSYYDNVKEEYEAISDFIVQRLDTGLIKEVDGIEDGHNGNRDALNDQLEEILATDSIGWCNNLKVELFSYEPSNIHLEIASNCSSYYLTYSAFWPLEELEPYRVGDSDMFAKTVVHKERNEFDTITVISLIKDDDGNPIALLDVSGEQQKLEKTINKTKQSIIITAVIMITVLAVLLFLLSIYINKNLRRTSAAIKDIGKGNYENRIKKITKDELGDIALSVNNMAEQIQKTQQSIITGISTMVESRDNSTGGHIRRTSLVISKFAGALMENKDEFGFDERFIFDVAKAAPMHDLGKIAVEDAVLKKPARFTPEEYEKMKVHAMKGAEIVGKVLEEIDDKDFIDIAKNVAHYHHEKWDGSGYPEGLKGEEIPIEARIMALADVYDALVSKRCYKEAFNYDRAIEIIKKDLGTHFDPKLGELFIAHRADFEALYDDIYKEDDQSAAGSQKAPEA